MATHDYVLDNASGAAFRTDLNNALAAIVSNNSNSSSPATTYAYQWWADTSAGVLKIRNSANNAWIELLQLDGTLTLEDGSASTPALAFRDDLDTGIFSSASNTFNIATGGVERMELGSTTIFNEDGADVDFRIEGDTDAALFFVNAGLDQIGIGTDSPQNRMHMHKGDSDKCVLQFTNSTTGLASGDGFQIGLSSSEQGLINMKESASILFKTADSDVMIIDSSGNVGIGTTSPRQKLDVTGNIFVSNGGQIQITGTGSSKGLQLIGQDDGTSLIGTMGSSGEHLLFRTASSEKMRIDTSGRVFIGTTTTSLGSSGVFGEFCLRGGTEGAGIHLADNDANVHAGFFTSDNSNFFVIRTITNHPMIFRTNNTERMRIDSSGRLLIGQTTVSSTEASGKLCVSAAISGGGQGVITGNDTSSNDFGCGLVVNKNSSTTTSSARFIQFYANNFGQPMGGIVGNGTENAQFATMSDERYKKNIKPLSGILQKINKLKTISFDWKHKDESVNAGFIAQNVQEIFPEYVVDNIGNDEQNKIMGTTGGMSAGYIAILTAAIQELSAKVAALEAA